MPAPVDYIVIGSGFGGSVSAFRLAQKGYKVVIIEAGKRWKPQDFPKSNWNTKKYLWLPKLFCYGILKITPFRHMISLSGVGVGGGSLGYGNTLIRPNKSFFSNSLIKKMGGMKGLIPYYQLAEKMLGVVTNPKLYEPDLQLKRTAKHYGREHTFKPSPVGIYFGNKLDSEKNKKVKDPYFFGEGPERAECNFCGACFIGCRYNAKNTLDKNYLYFAEKLGVKIIAEHNVTAIDTYSDNNSEGYNVIFKRTTGIFSRKKQYQTKGIVLAGGVVGTLKLLSKMKDQKRLPLLPESIGRTVRTNSETIIGVRVNNHQEDLSRGIAASSSVYPDEHTQIQADRYPTGSDALALLFTILTDGGGRLPRVLRFFLNILLNPLKFISLLNPFGFSKKSVILVVMQDTDSSLSIRLRRSWLFPFIKTLATALEGGKRIPTYIAIAHDFARKLAKNLKGISLSSINEVVFNTPMTAHILGGCIIGDDKNKTVDIYNRLLPYKNFYICDGSVLPVNLGVNPSLTIAAFTERAMSYIPPKEKTSHSIKWLKAETKWKVKKLIYRQQ